MPFVRSSTDTANGQQFTIGPGRASHRLRQDWFRRWPGISWQTRRSTGTANEEAIVSVVLWLIALIIGIVGIVQLLQGQIILGIVLLVVAFLVGPGGYSVFRSRTA